MTWTKPWLRTDIRGPIARQIGQALAEFYDRRIFRAPDRASGLSAAGDWRAWWFPCEPGCQQGV